MHAHFLMETFLREIEALPMVPLPWTLRETFTELGAAHGPAPSLALAAVYRGTQGVAAAVDHDRFNAYHNARHVGETLWAVVTLWGAEQQARKQAGLPLWPPEAGVKLWAAMMGHDLGHPGNWVDPQDTVNRGAIERLSAQRVAALLREEDVPEAWVNQIQYIIQNTEPFEAVPRARARWAANPDLDNLLLVMAAEADLLASGWFGTGPERGQWLAEEWHHDGHHIQANRVGSWVGRRAFLNHVVWTSAGACDVLRLPEWTAAERQVLTDQAEALDRLPHEQACAQHHAAVCARMALVAPNKDTPC